MKRLLMALPLALLILVSCKSVPSMQPLMAETQVLGTATNTPYSVGTEFVRIYQTPVPTCPPCYLIPLGTLTPTHLPMYTFTPTSTVAVIPTATPIVIEYFTIRQAIIYNNLGFEMERWEADTHFVTGDWIKNGRLYLGPTLKNRWISVGDFVRIQ